MSKLSVLSFADLSAEIRGAHSRATSDAVKQSWVTLLEIVESCGGRTSSAGGWDPATSESPWWLTNVTVSGFRGVPPSGLRFSFDPTPGITVIHGPNGSGKSSISDAIDVGLHQSVDASVERREGTGGNYPVWEPVLTNDRATEASIEIELFNADGRKLTIASVLTDGQMVTSSARLLSAEGIEAPIDLSAAWRSALYAYSPTYAYATWEQYIQRAKDLQQYLSRMLVLGGCFTQVAEEIEAQSRHSEAAKKRIEDAFRIGERRLQEAEIRFDRQRSVTISYDLDEDPRTWWSGNGLPNDEESTVAHEAVDVGAFIEATEAAVRALQGLIADSGASALAATAALNMLDQAAASESLSGPCPVCGSDVPWREHLKQTVAHQEAATASLRAWSSSLSAFLGEARGVLPGLMAAGARDDTTCLEEAHQLVQKLEDALHAGAVAMPESVALAWQAFDTIRSERFKSESARAAERASAESAWRAAQAAALRDFQATWLINQEDAMQARRWSDAKARLDDLEKRLKKRRLDSLEVATNETIEALLHDAGLRLSQLSVQKRQADLVLKDKSGRVLELGMLSAGQRNAVLLAPALSMAKDGPFGFLLIDDPVHSFDELRVDWVARQLIELSKHRRVVVLTHDERLREHLLASPNNLDSRSIRRNPDSHVVDVFEVGPMWRTLLDDAGALLALATDQAQRLGLTVAVRGLCRQAVDNALRILVTREAVRSGANPKEWLERLDRQDVGTTVQRFRAAADLPMSEESLTRISDAAKRLKTHLQRWNSAAHGNEPSSAATDTEIADAVEACQGILDA